VPDFFLVKDIHDVITHAKFGDDRLRGSGVLAGQISAFPIDFAGRPYNTLTLPCERVISIYLSIYLSVRFFVAATGHSFGAILTLSCSNDVISQPLVPFGGHINNAPY